VKGKGYTDYFYRRTDIVNRTKWKETEIQTTFIGVLIL